MKNMWDWISESFRKTQFKVKYLRLKRNLAFLGQSVYIHPSVDFQWSEKIHIGNNCKLYTGVILNARTSEENGIWLSDGARIHEYTMIDSYGGNIFLDEHAGIGHHCVIGGHGGLTIGKHSMIAGLTYIVSANHGFVTKEIPYMLQAETKKGVSIGDNVWIGINAIILSIFYCYIT